MDQQVELTPEIRNQINHAVESFRAVVNTLTDAEIEPAALVTGMTIVQVGYVASLAAMAGKPKEQVLSQLVSSLETMVSLVDHVYASVEEQRADNEQQ